MNDDDARALLGRDIEPLPGGLQRLRREIAIAGRTAKRRRAWLLVGAFSCAIAAGSLLILQLGRVRPPTRVEGALLNAHGEPYELREHLAMPPGSGIQWIAVHAPAQSVRIVAGNGTIRVIE